MNDYYIVIFFSEPDNGYIANIPDLELCSAWGETPEKALKEVLIAKTIWLKTAKEIGKLIPKPSEYK